jgi:dipeptidyl-peptidase-4
MKKIILLVLTFISVSTFAQNKELTLKDAVLGYYKGLYPKNMNGLQWVSDDLYMYKEDNKYVIKSIQNQKIINEVYLQDFQNIYSDLKQLPYILEVNEQYFIFRNGNEIVKFDYKAKKEKGKISFDKNAENLDFFSKNNLLAYTIENNLFIANSDNPKIQVTSINDKNIVSGQAIARYEFGIGKGTFWSPNGNFLAFYQKDESNVTDYPLVDITKYPASVKNIKYPMAGQTSEIAKVGVFNIKKNKVRYLKIDTSDEHYLTNLSWSPDEKYIFLAEVNRAQNKMEFNMYNIETGRKVKTLFTEKNDKWVEPETPALFLPNNQKEFVWISERDGFKNLFLYSIKGKLKKKLTNFKFPIKSILGFDKSGNNIVLSATGKDAKETHIYKVNIKYGEVTKITSKKGTHNGVLKGNHILDNFSSLYIPREISIINLEDGQDEVIFIAPNPLQDYKIGATEFMTLYTNDGKHLYSRMIKPANFDYNKKYPVLIYVYGGPHAQLVTNRWLGGAPLWMHWLATQKDYIVFTLDNRGSENRGFEFESVIHRNTGHAALEDQMKGVEYLKRLPYVDLNRIAVHGWSYGGFMTNLMMLKQPKTFTTGVAGGPVTDWKYYEIMYGERYMDTPQENPEGYKNTRIHNFINNLEGKLLLIHGSIDPVVVPQHSMTLLKEAVDNKIQLDFFTYPMHEHNVRGKDRVHLMQKVLDYILENNN